MKKVLIVATVSRFISSFELNNIKILQSLGYQVHCACNYKERGYKKDNNLDSINIIQHQINFARTPFRKENIEAYIQLKKLMKKYKFDLVDCHTPIGGVLARLVAKRYRKNGMKVIYTAHGFHFFKGSPVRNWIIYYPIEKVLSKYTDILITINREDYKRAKTFHARQVKYIPSVGVDVEKYSNTIINRQEKRKELGISKNAIVICSVGELSKRKNHQVIIRAISKIKNNNLYYIICGKGNLKLELERLSQQLGVDNRVKLLGYRTDINEICKISDIYAFPSIREGLGIAALEGMASGLPLITSNVNGILDYSKEGKTGFLCSPLDVNGFVEAINKLLNDKKLANKIGKYNSKVVSRFDIKKVNRFMWKIYNSI